MKGRNERKELCEGLEKKQVTLIIVVINRKQRFMKSSALPFTLLISLFAVSFPDGPGDAGRF